MCLSSFLLPWKSILWAMSKPKTVILLYDNCVLFEVTKTGMEMAKGSEIVTASMGVPAQIKTMDGFIAVPHTCIDDIPVDEIGCLVISGGPPENIYKHPNWEALVHLILKLNDAGKLIGGICGGVYSIVASGVLDGKSFAGDIRDYSNHPELLEKVEYKEVAMVINGNVVTAKDNAEIDFAVKLAEMSGFYKSKEDMDQTLAHYKNPEASVITS